MIRIYIIAGAIILALAGGIYEHFTYGHKREAAGYQKAKDEDLVAAARREAEYREIDLKFKADEQLVSQLLVSARGHTVGHVVCYKSEGGLLPGASVFGSAVESAGVLSPEAASNSGPPGAVRPHR